MSFLPEEYKVPVSSNYMKFVEGANVFRILSSAVIGYEYWNTQDKPVRLHEKPEEIPEDIKIEKDGSIKINHFWAFVVYNYEAKKIQILELTQKSIMIPMKKLYVDNPKWGNPAEYDFVVNKTGSGFDTEYSTGVNPKSPLDEKILKQYEKLNIDLEKLFIGEDPFGKK